MNIDDLTIGQMKEIQSMGVNQSESMFKIGKKYIIRTVTHIDTGECVEIKGDFVRLKNAAWIADTGRYHDCLRDGVFNEVEPYPENMRPFVNTASIIDACEWPHELPTEQK